MNADAWKKSLLLHLPYGVIGLAAAKLSEAWRLSAGTDFSAKFLHLRDGAAMAFRNGLSGFVPLDLLIGFLCGCALCLLVHAKRRNAKKYRHGEEYGAARWGKPTQLRRGQFLRDAAGQHEGKPPVRGGAGQHHGTHCPAAVSQGAHHHCRL